MPPTLLGSKARSLGTSMLRLMLITLVINIAKGDCGRIMRRAISACASGFGGSSPDHGGRSSLDIVRLSKRSITKIEPDRRPLAKRVRGTSAATGQAVGGRPSSRVGSDATLNLPGLKIHIVVLEAVHAIRCRSPKRIPMSQPSVAAAQNFDA